MENNKRKTWIQYGIMGAVVIVLYATGLHAEVIGYAQRGLLWTGIVNPPEINIVQTEKDENIDNRQIRDITKADFNLQLRSAEGDVISLADLRGKVIFMNIWATWCPPCIAEMPGIASLHEEMGDEVAFVMLSVDQEFETAIAYKSRKGYDLPIYEPVGGLPEMYQSSSLPTTFVINAKGDLVLSHKGMAAYDTPEFREFLKGLR